MFDFHDLPASPGDYVLQLFVARPQSLTVGRLGQHLLPAGHYFYAGSARGAGGLQSRVGRHLRDGGKPHWHIDILRAVADARGVFYTVTDNPLECLWSQALAQLPYAVVPVPYFGASDCRSGCATHLIAFPLHADIAVVAHALDQYARAPVVCLRFR